MNWEAIGAVGEVVGAAGVVVSLVYLAVQIRLNTGSLRLASQQQLAQLSVVLNVALGVAPGVAGLYTRGLDDPEALGPDEQAQLTQLLHAVARIRELMYLQHQVGALDEATWRGFETSITSVFVTPAGRRWWAGRAAMLHEDFRTWMDAQIEKPAPVIEVSPFGRAK